jgi:hypothetical protein
MDQELIAYLEKNFAQIGQRFAQMMDERFARMDERFARMDERFARIDERFEKQDEQFRSFREETTRRFGHLDEGVRHTQVLVEGLWGDLRLVADGVVGLDERLMAFRKEVAQDIDDVRKLIRPIYSALDQRVRNLEIRKDLQGRDPIDIIRERFGKPSE